MRLQNDLISEFFDMKINGIGVTSPDQDMKMKDQQLVRVGGDVLGAFDDEVITALANTQDLIGAVLRVHFCLEEFLNIWCNKVTNNKDFFDFGFIGFDKKIKIAVKLGLPENLSVIFKLFNSIRNKYAHDTSAQITMEQLNDIRVKIDNLPNFGSQPIPKCDDPSFESLVGDKVLSWNGINISTKDRIVFLYFVFSMKILGSYVVEFQKRNIPFNYAR